jgi:hypothetical protein
MSKDKKFSKTVVNKETGRKKTVKYGAKGYRIKPGTDAGDSYCARSEGIKKEMLAKGGESAKKANDPNSPNSLSRKKWKCNGSKSSKK